MNDYILKASRLIGEIQQLSILVHMQTEMGCEVDYSSNVAEVMFWLAPTKEAFKKRFKDIVPEEILHTSFYIRYETWNNTESKQQKTLTKLLKIKRLLINALKEKNIDYGTLDYTIETVEYKRYVI
ncbi:hypothetical protein J1P26_17410 [Neobacillus sp. MM2021_6]|uniref:hypothetical protein n=1 Tax=Bacillaceae TaxID=186817 RepID=UPI00140B9976|nr:MULTISPECIES: hypothetical protein [Bacillaceae]MBO0961487.1 hypothetical protein [Neobacillus sp. MM2021_6]